jgi:putative endonuclease
MGGIVYIMASKRHGTIYTGVTSDLAWRVWEHKAGVVAGFTQRYQVHDLVYYECHDRIEAAIQREHNIKHWPRRWKTALVERHEPRLGRSLFHDSLRWRGRLGGRVKPGHDGAGEGS